MLYMRVSDNSLNDVIEKVEHEFPPYDISHADFDSYIPIQSTNGMTVRVGNQAVLVEDPEFGNVHGDGLIVVMGNGQRAVVIRHEDLVAQDARLDLLMFILNTVEF